MQIEAMLSPVWEGAFWRDDFLRLKFPACSRRHDVYAFLTRQVRRSPDSLQFHVCRIRIAALIDEEALYAALLDLFWILEEKGQSLKQRVLEWAQGRLATDRLAALQACLRGDLKVRQLPFSFRSVLHDGMCGQEVDLPATDPEKIRAEKDPLTIARLCLELGQLEQAQEILSEQIKVEPSRAELRQMLLQIYLARQDEESFKDSYLWLESVGCLDEAWQAAARQFEQLV